MSRKLFLFIGALSLILFFISASHVSSSKGFTNWDLTYLFSIFIIFLLTFFFPDVGKKHPEQIPDEVFIGNSDENDFINNIGWKTKRRGEVAYDKNGKPLSKYTFPVFVKRWEIENDDPKTLKRLEAK